MGDSSGAPVSADRAGKYALFVSIPLIGHINPLLPQAEELARRGWKVALANTSEVRQHVEGQSPGVEFVDLGPLGPLAARLQQTEVEGVLDPSLRRGTARMTGLFLEMWPIMYPALRASIQRRRPDVMIVNIVAFAGGDAATVEGVPFVINNPYLLDVLPPTVLPPAEGMPLHLSGKARSELGLRDRLIAPLFRLAAPHLMDLTMGRKLNAVRQAHGLAPVAISEVLRDKLILSNSAFGLEYGRPLPPLVQMVGPMISEHQPLEPELKAWIEGGPPVVYVNLGTLAVASRDVVLRMVPAFASDAFRVLWVLRKQQQEHLPAGKVPANVRVESWVPSTQAVLRHENVKVFVSHCGINSAQESLHAGTPIVGIPILAGQSDMAARVRDAGVGVILDKSRFTSGELREAVLRVLRDDSFRRAIPAIQSSFALAGGAKRAADLIEHFADVGIAHLSPGRLP